MLFFRETITLQSINSRLGVARVLGCPWPVIVTCYLVSWFLTYLRYLQPTYTGVIIHLQSTMDIPVWLRLILRAIRSIFTFSLGDLGPNYEFPRKHYGRQATREGFCVCCGGNGGFTQIDGAVGVACCVAFHGLRLEVGAWLSKFPSFPTQPQSLNSQFIPLAKWPRYPVIPKERRTVFQSHHFCQV